ncbi:hypothetical protein ASZ78_000968 [Callipepla squamata]|uniref:Dynein axonemal assembly factor 8 n=1 Tax=Callipepla squamata TaxID=9009 RepID=A0A226MXK4_CALSU|nr:hypothetical protein ASZ78_000968 [Callipepla squamata]
MGNAETVFFILRDVAYLSSSPSSLRMDTVRLQCLPEPQTVYIDLRDAELQKSVTFPGEKESAGDSSTEEDETVTVTEPSERKMKNCSGKSLLLQQLHRAPKEVSELLHKAPVPDERLESVKQDPENLEETGAFKLSQNQNFKVRQGMHEAISRKLVRLEPEKGNTSLSSQRGNGADIVTKIKMKTGKVRHSRNASESPLPTKECPRYHTGKVTMFLNYGLSNCVRLRNTTCMLCELEQKDVSDLT